MENYKDQIRNTRCGALGSSDGKLILQVAESGIIQKSAYKRLAVCKGLIEQEDIPQTAAVRAGDELEIEALAIATLRGIKLGTWEEEALTERSGSSHLRMFRRLWTSRSIR